MIKQKGYIKEYSLNVPRLGLRLLSEGIPGSSIPSIFDSFNAEYHLWSGERPKARYYQSLRNSLSPLNDENTRQFIAKSEALLMFSDSTPNARADKIYVSSYNLLIE